MILLDLMGAATSGGDVNGMTDVIFGVKDVIIIGGFIVTLLTAFLSLKFSHKSHKEATEKEFINTHEKFDIIHGRIDKAVNEMKSNQDKNNNEFKEINKSLNTIIGILKNKK